MQRSSHHLEFVKEHEYFLFPNGDLYRSHLDNTVNPDTGYRDKARFVAHRVNRESTMRLIRRRAE